MAKVDDPNVASIKILFMDTKKITLTAKETLFGNTPFPQIVGMLIEAGVEYYHVDYAGRFKSFYGPDGDRVVTSITYENLPLIPPELNIEALRANIRDSQQNNQRYHDFSVRAMQAGVQGYFAFLRGKRIIYFGRTGDSHTEWFPGAKS